MKTAIIDIDNTLLDYSAGFESFMRSHGHEKEAEHTYDLMDHYPSVSCKDEMFKYVCMFNCSEEFAHLNPNPYMVSFVQDLKEQGYQMIALSSFVPPYDFPQEGIYGVKSELYRSDNLDKVLGKGFFDRIIYRRLGESKHKEFTYAAMACEELLIVDDAEKYLREAINVQVQFQGDVDVKVFIYDQPYNNHIESRKGVIRLDTQYFLDFDQ